MDVENCSLIPRCPCFWNYLEDLDVDMYSKIESFRDRSMSMLEKGADAVDIELIFQPMVIKVQDGECAES